MLTKSTVHHRSKHLSVRLNRLLVYQQVYMIQTKKENKFTVVHSMIIAAGSTPYLGQGKRFVL